MCCVEDVFTHNLDVDFTLLVELIVVEHLLRPQVAEEYIVVLRADHENGVLHFVQNIKELFLLVQDVTAFQV
jgi:hypothetical protein